MNAASPSDSGARRPNIIVVMVDDMGFSDIGSYGSEISTPALDQMAEGGMAFRQMYNCARCCPTRASLLTGLYPHQAGIGGMVNDLGYPAYQGYLNDRCVTLAEALGAGGYRTFMSGKWHVGGGYNVQRPDTWTPGDPTHPTPVQRGFEEHFGTLCGAGSYWFPPTLSHNDTFLKPERSDFYLTDEISNHATRMIDRACDETPGQPFLMYVAYTAPHWPLHAPHGDIEKYRGKYAKGWDALRTARHEELKASGILDPKWPISPRDPEVPAWDDIPDKDYQDALMATYAAMVERMDAGVGSILARLKQRGIEENTLVLFLSDNGGCHEFIRYGSSWADRLQRQTLEGEDVTVGNAPGVLPGPDSTYQSYNRPWANASNTPFRMHKHWVHEGGIATPLIAYWPGKIAPGRQTERLSHVVDIMATCIEASGAEYPEQYNGKPITPMAGESFLPTLMGQVQDTSERVLYWEHEGNIAVRHGRWKLVQMFERVGEWELYDMAEDRTELDDLSVRKDGEVRRLEKMYNEWADRIGVVPR
ncbi:MAG: arylsulfatase [Phycisphaerae bacterium]